MSFSHLMRFHHLTVDNDTQWWNGECFDKESLQNIGYHYQLGHSGTQCPLPHPGPKNFVVFDISGPHLVTIDYCDCRDKPLSTWTQLLREKWFPAMLTRPQMAFTFDCLETFHELTLQGKTNLYDYYHTLLRRSDNANLSNPIVSSRSYLSSLTNLYINSISTRNFIVYLECGRIWWPSNAEAEVTIQGVLMPRWMENWWSNAPHALIWREIFLMTGRRPAPSCKLFLNVVSFMIDSYSKQVPPRPLYCNWWELQTQRKATLPLGAYARVGGLCSRTGVSESHHRSCWQSWGTCLPRHAQNISLTNTWTD